MKLTIASLQDKSAWEQAGIAIPSYDVQAASAAAAAHPQWVHFGIGNIFRIFIGGLADRLIASGEMAGGITCVESFDFDVVDKIYAPFDNLVMAVTLNPDGTTTKEVYGSLAEAVKANFADPAARARLKTVFTDPGLQMVSFTITEKGYGLTAPNGEFFPFIKADIENGPEKATGAMGIVCALLYDRYLAGKAPLAVVSMDNCSHNGEKLRNSVLKMAEQWTAKGFLEPGFLEYVSDESVVSFPWSMIDKITPRPADQVGEELKKAGVEDMDPVITSKRTYIAPFANAERPQYLVIEDNFPNGRPALEKVGVYMTDRETVNKVERMKVTTCLNPLHTALAVYGCMLGYDRISAEMQDPELVTMIKKIGLVEGMPVVTDPGILSPAEFVREVIEDRLPNVFMPDTPQRIACDTSQKVGIRFGETIKSYIETEGTAAKLEAIPLAIAGWCRYLLGLDDNGEAFELSTDPLLADLQPMLAGIEFGKPETYTGQLKPILSNVNIFGVDLYAAGLGEKIEGFFTEEIAGPGSIRATLKKYLD